MTLLELLVLLKRHLRIVVAVPVVCALIVGVYSLAFMHETYTVSANLYAKSSASVAGLLESEAVLGKAADDLGLSGHGAFEVEASYTSSFTSVTLEVTGDDPDEAADFANAVAERAVESANTSSEETLAAVTDEATSPGVVNSPKRLMYIAVGFLAGLFVVVAGVVLADMLDGRVCSRREAEEIVGAPVLGEIPLLEDVESRRKSFLRSGAGAADATYVDNEVKTLATNVRFAAEKGGLKSVAVVSAVPGEGRTFVAMHLAKALAEGGKRVLLVDCNLRKPAFAGVGGAHGSLGLAAVAAGAVGLAEAAAEGEVPGVLVLGAEEGISDPADLLMSEGFKRLCRQACEEFDFTVFDTPALLPFADASAVASAADVALVVCGMGLVEADELVSVCERLERAGANVAGAVLNRCEVVGAAYGHYSHYVEEDTR